MAKNKKEEERRKVAVEIDIDTTRLFNTIDEAIRYLTEIRQKYRDISLYIDVGSTGYDDVESSFVYYRDETDEEIADRLKEEKLKQKLYNEEARREAQRKKDFKELERLKNKLGIWR